MEQITIREMIPEDYTVVKKIYENGIATGLATFETTAPEWDVWNTAHLKFARLVAIENLQIAGWAALTAVSNRCVYGGVAEVSIYINENNRGKGIGKKLLLELIKESEANGIWTLQSGIFKDNLSSIKLHESAGFRTIGYREKIGKLNGKWQDTILMEKRSVAI